MKYIYLYGLFTNLSVSLIKNLLSRFINICCQVGKDETKWETTFLTKEIFFCKCLNMYSLKKIWGELVNPSKVTIL